MRLLHGDCIEKMKELETNSVDSIVTDPPYGLSFMGKGWDYGVPGVEFWQEALRVAKPGTYLLSFGGTRTFHRLAVAIEDAGWEIRDTVMWVYGSGFPKSHNLKGDWDGWGTALKPAWEPIIVARKPLEGTVAENVVRYGTGGINVDGCRISTDEMLGRPQTEQRFFSGLSNNKWNDNSTGLGRWPANMIHDGSDEVVEMFPNTKSGKMGPWNNRTTDGSPNGIYGKFDANHPLSETYGDSGSAARFFYCAKASKADRDEGLDKNNHHPTVKPTALMRYLCKLVTQPGGIVLDPFMGSGSTGKAAMLEGFDFIGIEQDNEYIKIAEARIKAIYLQSRKE